MEEFELKFRNTLQPDSTFITIIPTIWIDDNKVENTVDIGFSWLVFELSICMKF